MSPAASSILVVEMALIFAGALVSVGGVAVLASGVWLHEPGFAGDPTVRMLEGTAYAATIGVGVALLVAGVALINRGAKRRRPSSSAGGLAERVTWAAWSREDLTARKDS